MENLNNENLPTSADDKSSDIHFDTRGYREATKFYPNFHQFRDKLKIVCNDHTKISDSAKQKITDSIQENINQQLGLIDYKENEINSKELEKNKLLEELSKIDIEKNNLTLIISGSIVVILGIALFLFYGLTLSGVVGTLVRSSTNQMQDDIQATLPTLWDNFVTLPFILKIISILLAVLPLGIGFLIHEYKQKKQWTAFLSILIFVFILDVVIAFVVEKQIYSQESLLSELPPFNEYLIDNILGTFGAIILLGFGAYFVWGMLLDTFLTGLNPKLLTRKTETKINILNSKITQLKSDIENINTKIDNLKEEIKKLVDSRIAVFDDDSRKTFEKNLTDYTSGWERHIVNYHGGDRVTSKAKVEELHSIKKEIIADFYSQFESKK